MLHCAHARGLRVILLVGLLATAAPGCSYLITGTVGEASKGTSAGTTDGDTSNGWFITSMVAVGVGVAATLVWGVEELSSAKAYLDRNRREVRIALARGHGAFVSDIADAIDAPVVEVGRVGRALRAARDRLEPLLAGPIGDAEAVGFFRTVTEALHDDPVLAARIAQLAPAPGSEG